MTILVVEHRVCLELGVVRVLMGWPRRRRLCCFSYGKEECGWGDHIVGAFQSLKLIWCFVNCPYGLGLMSRC